MVSVSGESVSIRSFIVAVPIKLPGLLVTIPIPNYRLEEVKVVSYQMLIKYLVLL